MTTIARRAIRLGTISMLTAGLAVGLSQNALAADACSITPTKPTPAPGPSTINLPADQYNHPQYDTEWWFLIGTVKSGDRSFGIEINIARFANAISQSYVKIADVTGDKNHAEVIMYPMAQLKTSDTDFSAELPNAKISGTLEAMTATGKLADGSGTLDLSLGQVGPPLVVFGTGRQDLGGFVTNYYALTNLQTKGKITLNGETFDVTGKLWMDHEYGGWGKHVTWSWTGTQLDNGVSIMAFSGSGAEIDKPHPGVATVLMPDGKEFFEDITMTARGPTWTSEETGETYFTGWTLAIPGQDACLTLVSKPAGQEFTFVSGGKALGGVYEAVSSISGTFNGQPVNGTSWNEQAH